MKRPLPPVSVSMRLGLERDELYNNNNDDEDDEKPLLNVEEIYGGSVKSYSETKAWDVFRVLPPEQDSGSNANQRCQQITVQILKIVAYIVTFIIVLGGAVVAKGTFLFMTSQIRPGRTLEYCNKFLQRDKHFKAVFEDTQRVAWIWCIFFAFLIPEAGTLFRSTRMCVFKSWKRPLLTDFLLVWIFESFHVVGVALLCFVVFPLLDVVKGIMLTNCLCLVPAILGLLSRHLTMTANSPTPESKGKVASTRRSKLLAHYTKVVLDVAAILIQVSGFLIWPWIGPHHSKRQLAWAIPTAAVLTSCGWWENFVDRRSPFSFVKRMAGVKDRLDRNSRYYTYIFVSMWKMLLFFGCMLFFLYIIHGDDPSVIFSKMTESFGDHMLNVKEVVQNTIDYVLPDLDSSSQPFSVTSQVKSTGRDATITLAVHVVAAWACYVFGKFACKIVIQGFSYAFPVNLTVPVTLSLLISACGLRNDDPCFLLSNLPNHLYWECPQGDFLHDFVTSQHGWVWILWLLSQTWITVHIWTPKGERLATTERLFVSPMYNSFLIDQSLALNRRRDDEDVLKTDDVPSIEFDDGIDDSVPHYETVGGDYCEIPPLTKNGSLQRQSLDNGIEKKQTRSSDNITRIFATATMWHETTEEMMEMLKSIMRMDEDQSARRVAQKYLKVVDPDYYEFETHILFDDAFELSDDVEDEVIVNRFVKQLIEIIDDAASHVHQINVKLRPPKKYPTPYGGRLVWTLPGKNKIVCHLKDKAKIRHRKRWSQVMYMYYLLGHRLMELPISVDRKEIIAENTFLLALDGDIDFQPHAVQLLVDLMKKNRNLGAACGRIHPVGNGPMQWYQKFEYAIGHWLQKSTEHMIGCVLCSPGCFSLFRAKALMDDNVMRRYTLMSHEARHYVQYDQGEDRWLCTLLLQRGYRVEYSAASDAYTHCPEGFNEFYNQRRRWVPSTMANIMDLLMSAKHTIKINDNISLPYIIYQFMLMIGTILGPGTIFLMLVGAFVAAFRIDNWSAFYYNIIPILLFIFVCFVLESKWQLVVAQIFSAGYSLIMMAVLVGTALQLGEDGIGSPSAMFLSSLSGSFFIAALLHPQEFTCVFHGFLYLLSIPSMYLLLIIYSLVNLNNVSWGTREVLTKKSKKELEQEKEEAEEARKAQQRNALLGFMRKGSGDPEDEGSFELSFAGLFKILCCTHPKAVDEKQQLLRIADHLESVSKRIAAIEQRISNQQDQHDAANHHNQTHHGHHAGASGSHHGNSTKLIIIGDDKKSQAGTVAGKDEDSTVAEDNGDDSHNQTMKRDDLINPFWLEAPIFKRGQVEYLSGPEVAFWNDLIEKYLHPIDMSKEQKATIANDLKELRNRSFFFFFMCNAIFVLIVFLLQLNKDELHIRWPFGVQTNITVVGDEVFVEKQYLQLEPLGLVFVFFFALILVIQFTAMLFHRFGTISHILASTELSCFSFKEKKDEMTEDQFLKKNAVALVKELQRLRGIDGDNDSDNGSGMDRREWLGRRKTIHALERHRKKKREIGTLDVAFKKRFFALSGQRQTSQENGAPKRPALYNLEHAMGEEALKALEKRRNYYLVEEDGQKTGSSRRMETLGKKAGAAVAAKLKKTVESPLEIDCFDANSVEVNGITNPVYNDSEEVYGAVPLRNLNNFRRAAGKGSPTVSTRANGEGGTIPRPRFSEDPRV